MIFLFVVDQGKYLLKQNSSLSSFSSSNSHRAPYLAIFFLLQKNIYEIVEEIILIQISTHPNINGFEAKLLINMKQEIILDVSIKRWNF